MSIIGWPSITQLYSLGMFDIPRWREAIQSLSWLVDVAFHVAKYDLNYLQCFVMMENEAPDWQGGGKKCVVCEANKQPAQL